MIEVQEAIMISSQKVSELYKISSLRPTKSAAHELDFYDMDYTMDVYGKPVQFKDILQKEISRKNRSENNSGSKPKR